jgi:hypothetical protein
VACSGAGNVPLVQRAKNDGPEQNAPDALCAGAAEERSGPTNQQEGKPSLWKRTTNQQPARAIIAAGGTRATRPPAARSRATRALTPHGPRGLAGHAPKSVRLSSSRSPSPEPGRRRGARWPQSCQARTGKPWWLFGEGAAGKGNSDTRKGGTRPGTRPRKASPGRIKPCRSVPDPRQPAASAQRPSASRQSPCTHANRSSECVPALPHAEHSRADTEEPRRGVGDQYTRAAP